MQHKRVSYRQVTEAYHHISIASGKRTVDSLYNVLQPLLRHILKNIELMLA